MADNPPQPPQPPQKPAPLPPLRTGVALPSAATGRLKAATTKLPNKIGNAGKIVVMLSSVAKPPPAVTQNIPFVAPPLKPPASKVISKDSDQIVRQPAPLPPKTVSPAEPPTHTSGKLTSTTFVKLPPKTSTPGWSSLAPKPAPVVTGPMPSDKSALQTTPKKSGPQHIPPIKLNEPAADTNTPSESIFLSGPDQAAAKTEPEKKPPGGKALEAGELTPPKEGLDKLEVFAKSQRIDDKPASETADKATPLVAPPLIFPKTPEPAKSALNPAPVDLKPGHALHVAPPMIESEKPEPHAEKLPLPHLPSEGRKVEPATPPALPPSVVAKAPASVPHVAPGTPLPPPILNKVSDDSKKAAPVLATPTTKTAPNIAEAKPALKPAVLPKRAMQTPAKESEVPPALPPIVPIEAKAPASKLETKAEPPSVVKPETKPEPKAEPKIEPKVEPTAEPKVEPKAESKPEAKVEPPPMAKPELKAEPKPEAKAESKPDAKAEPKLESVLDAKPEPKSDTKPEEKKTIATKPPIEKEKSVVRESILPLATAATAIGAEKISAKIETKKTEPAKSAAPAFVRPEAPALPPTRAERAKKRRTVSTLIFWGLMMPATGLGLFFGSLYFDRDTRIEGQVIPPPGMTVNSEIWVVSDFRQLASGIAEDLAAERTPLMQESQERREHVQRAQADVASREERIRLIQEQIAAAKDEIASLVKQSRDATQQIWDGEGAQIDDEYQSKLNQLKHAIADRAKSLNLKYEADDTYQSPEVWANAYRLALYQVPAGVDGLKEHQWLGEQMKGWRDFQKTLDDRKEKLREKAAAVKLAPGPKIADLNAKIEDLGQRIDATASEEVPLKAELQQAQIDLAQAQAADDGLDEKYYKQLYSLPSENITKHILVKPNGRFTWLEEDNFAEGEKEHKYWIFTRATRSDGRQYWVMGHISIEKNHKMCLFIEPESFVSTKAILRPNLSPEEQAQ